MRRTRSNGGDDPRTASRRRRDVYRVPPAILVVLLQRRRRVRSARSATNTNGTVDIGPMQVNSDLGAARSRRIGTTSERSRLR